MFSSLSFLIFFFKVNTNNEILLLFTVTSQKTYRDRDGPEIVTSFYYREVHLLHKSVQEEGVKTWKWIREEILTQTVKEPFSQKQFYVYASQSISGSSDLISKLALYDGMFRNLLGGYMFFQKNVCKIFKN